MPNRTTEDLPQLRERVALSTTFGWHFVSGLSAIVFREKGERALNDLWSMLMRAEQNTRFREALAKLGIADGPPAVVAARYHYFSNSIGGLKLHYMEESPRKVWIRYLAPWGSFPGIAALTVPTSIRRTILSTWHPRNGELLGCPRLGWVATKFIAEGHPYDEGYFCEYDHDLRFEERMQVRPVETSPEFDPEKAPKLDPIAWPEARILKGSASYAADYALHVVEAAQKLFGVPAATQFVETAARMLAVQFIHTYAAMTGAANQAPDGLAHMFAAIVRSFRNDCAIERRSTDAIEVQLRSWAPFQPIATERMRAALFEFVAMGTRVQNGRVSAERAFDAATGIERWTFTDRKRWLW
jgi:hypothetical protein